MTFHNDDKPLFDVPLSDVSTATVNKNEVKIFIDWFLMPDLTKSPILYCDLWQVTVEFHQDDDNDLSLVEMRFYVPNISNDTDVPADQFHKNVMKYAAVIKATGDVIVKFEQVLLQTPR